MVFPILLSINALWFGLAFNTFSVKHASTAARLFVRKEDRQSSFFQLISQLLRFLGGMNLAFLLLCILVLFNLDLFSTAGHKCVLFLVFSLAHGTQFYFNVLVIRLKAQSGVEVWPVTTGLMAFIFVVDGMLMLLNLIIALYFCYALV